MPVVNGKEYAYTPKGIAAAKKAAKAEEDEYYRNPDGSFFLDEGGSRIKKPGTPTNKSSADADRHRTEMRGRGIAKRKAIKALMGTIPASPTR